MLSEQKAGRQGGFTLLELMIVVTIVGILAATAMPAFQSYLMRARANEGLVMVQAIKLRQESYRSEFASYVTAPPQPGAINGMNYVAWPADPAWDQLGFVPSGRQTRFMLQATAGPPGAAPANMTGNDFWYLISATGDLNGDGTLLRFEGYSEADFIWCSSARGFE